MRVSAICSSIVPALGLFAVVVHGAPSASASADIQLGLIKRTGGSGTTNDRIKIENLIDKPPTCSNRFPAVKTSCENSCKCLQAQDGTWILTGCNVKIDGRHTEKMERFRNLVKSDKKAVNADELLNSFYSDNECRSDNGGGCRCGPDRKQPAIAVSEIIVEHMLAQGMPVVTDESMAM